MDVITSMMISMTSKIQSVFFGFISVAGTIFLATVMDVAPLITLTYVLIFFHVFSGFILKVRTKSKWSDEKWFKTGMKILLFPIAIAATSFVEQTFEIDFKLTAIVAAYLAIHDLHGLFANIGKLTGVDIWSAISERLSANSFGTKPKSKDE